jgi:calcineurin-like phosphoesterase family protein
MAQQLSQPKNKILIGSPILRFKEEDIPNIFFTSDLHIQHKNILHFTPRGGAFQDVEDMDSSLLNSVNNPAILYPNSTNMDKLILFHCGDLLFGQAGLSQSFYKMIQDSLSSYHRIYAVAGNHDRNNILMRHQLISSYSDDIMDGTECNTKWFWNNMYIVEIYRGSQCIMVFTVSHFPMEEYHGSFNIHGHLHSYKDMNPEDHHYVDWHRWSDDGHHFDCGVDNNQYQAVALTDILDGKTDIKIKEIPQTSGLKFKYQNQ